MNFSIKIDKRPHPTYGDIPIVRLFGTVEQKNLVALEEAILNFYQQKIYRIILDLGKVENLNSSALGLLINFTVEAHKEGGAIRLIHVQEKHKMLFNLLGLGDRLQILSDENTAMSSWE